MPLSPTAHARWRNQPVVRDRLYTGNPVTSNVSTVDRSDVIRRIFTDRGRITATEVLHLMAIEGLSASTTLIYAQKRRLINDGVI